MPVLKEKLGEKGYEELESFIVEKIKLHSVERDEFREVLSRLDIVEHDLADLKVEVRELRREMNERFDRMNESINERLDRMNESINERFDRMYERMTSLMKWTIGTLVLFGTIISILIAIGQFIK
ncbi:MAG: hypothetical protein DRP87_17770 [Spirochaetes bacterium]|nr:MAG: hypothetical protein DRP87_17770 [Spirochaetota bacterium]